MGPTLGRSSPGRGLTDEDRAGGPDQRGGAGSARTSGGRNDPPAGGGRPGGRTVLLAQCVVLTDDSCLARSALPAHEQFGLDTCSDPDQGMTKLRGTDST